MAVVSEIKNMDLQKTSLVIRRCPFCHKDTEQQAYYAHNPDMKVTAHTPTEPSESVVVEFNAPRKYEWYGLEECKVCGNAYIAQGTIPIINKEITGKTESMQVRLAYTCCDFCIHEEYKYVLANMQITLKNGRNLYLCDRHAAEIKKDKGDKSDSYDFLQKRLDSWLSFRLTPKIVTTSSGKRLALRNELTLGMLLALRDGKSKTLKELTKEMGFPEENVGREVKYLEAAGFLNIKIEGSLLKQTRIYLSEDGNSVANVSSL